MWPRTATILKRDPNIIIEHLGWLVLFPCNEDCAPDLKYLSNIKSLEEEESPTICTRSLKLHSNWEVSVLLVQCLVTLHTLHTIKSQRITLKMNYLL